MGFTFHSGSKELHGLPANRDIPSSQRLPSRLHRCAAGGARRSAAISQTKRKKMFDLANFEYRSRVSKGGKVTRVFISSSTPREQVGREPVTGRPGETPEGRDVRPGRSSDLGQEGPGA